MLSRLDRLRRCRGFNPLSLSPVLYIKDFSIVVGGYFVDSSGNNKQIQAATTTTTNDSLIMPANDSQIIAALTAAGCYSQYYTDNSTPKKVKISNISPCYNNYAYYNYFDKKNLMVFSSDKSSSRDVLLKYINTHICYFNSVQGATPEQVSITYQCYTNKLAYVDYGNWGGQDIQQVNATEANHVLSSVGYAANKTYNIQLFTPQNNNGWKKIQIANIPSLSNINSSHFVGMSLTYFYLYASGTNHIINSSHFVGMPLTYFRLYHSGTNHIINSSHFVGMPLTYFMLYNSGSNHSGTISDITTDISTLTIYNSGNNISITTGGLKEWAATTIILQSSYPTASVDGFLVTWAPIAGVGAKTISLAGTNETCTTSDPMVSAAITTLQGKGKTIVIN